jgi:hypothetical protein
MRIQSRLQLHKNSSIDSYLSKGNPKSSNNTTTGVKKRLNLVNNNSLSGLSSYRQQAASPVPGKDFNSEYTPMIIKSRQQSGRSLISSNSLFKEYAETSRYYENTAKILGKLPNIDFKRFNNIKKLTDSPGVNIFKKTFSKNNILSMETGSTNNTIIHKRTLSNFTKKKV